MKLFLMFAGTLLSFYGALAQHTGTTQFSFTASGASYRASFALAAQRQWQFGGRRQFGVGVGVRATSFVAANQYYITAPAELTSGSTGPLVIFKENIAANIDSLLIKSPQVNMVNVFVNLTCRLSPRLSAGFNIDLVGGSFGAEQAGNFMSGIYGKNTRARPTPFNVLLISDNDRGSLNSEAYVRYALTGPWAVSAGAQFLFTEYTTATPVQQVPEANDRFRNKSLLFNAGIVYSLAPRASR